MKKMITAGVFAIFGVLAMASCKKSYECVDSSGTVISTCEDCKGLTKDAFDSSCALAGGTVQAK